MAIPHNRYSFTAVLIIFALAVVLNGCGEDIVCEDATATLLRTGFYRLSDTGSATAISVDSITIYGIGRAGDNIYDNKKNVLRIELPVNPSLDSTGFVFEFPDNAKDTLWIFYIRHLNLISVECGFSMFYEIEGTRNTHYMIDTLEVSNNLISNSLDEHIKIILNPHSDQP